MTEERWQRIAYQMEMGDPLKDIWCDAEELFTYCEDLRARLANLETPTDSTGPCHGGTPCRGDRRPAHLCA